MAAGRLVVEFLPKHSSARRPRGSSNRSRLNCRFASTRSARSWWCATATSACPTCWSTPPPIEVTGLIDLGRLGTADPYGDIALLLATARETWPDEAMARRADQEFAEIYGTELDPERQDFYLRLDPLTW